jgi:hypothetical protein
MGWAIGWDSNWNRDIGYGVPAFCDHPDCSEVIDRGLSYVCGGGPYGESLSDTDIVGCGLFFCGMHLGASSLCERCSALGNGELNEPFPAKPDHPEWIHHKMTDPSWEQWRKENKEKAE